MNKYEMQSNIDQAAYRLGLFQKNQQPVYQQPQPVYQESAVEIRLHQANLYKLLLENDFFDNINDPIVEKVNNELKEFILGKMNTLLGITQQQPQQQKTDFTQTEIVVLKMWAGKLVGNENIVFGEQKAEQPTPQPVQPVQPTQLQQNQLPEVKPVSAPVIKRRGRPPKVQQPVQTQAPVQQEPTPQPVQQMVPQRGTTTPPQTPLAAPNVPMRPASPFDYQMAAEHMVRSSQGMDEREELLNMLNDPSGV